MTRATATVQILTTKTTTRSEVPVDHLEAFHSQAKVDHLVDSSQAKVDHLVDFQAKVDHQAASVADQAASVADQAKDSQAKVVHQAHPAASVVLLVHQARQEASVMVLVRAHRAHQAGSEDDDPTVTTMTSPDSVEGRDRAEKDSSRVSKTGTMMSSQDEVVSARLVVVQVRVAIPSKASEASAVMTTTGSSELPLSKADVSALSSYKPCVFYYLIQRILTSCNGQSLFAEPFARP